MQVIVNPSDELPIYRQIMRQIVEAIAGGRLKTGEKLPSHRELSERIVVAPLTVKKAYDELEALGFSLVIFPGGIVRALAKAAQDYYGSLRASGSTDPFRERMFDFNALNAVIGTPEMLARGKRYAGDGAGSK